MDLPPKINVVFSLSTGPSSVSPQQTNLVYTVTNAQAGATYTWTVPSSVQILSGQGTSSLTVKWGNSSGNVGCTASNSCGSSQKTNYYVTVISSLTASGGGEGSSISKTTPLLLDVKVMPNPTEDYFTLTMSSNSNEPVQVRVLDMYGKVLFAAHGSVKDHYRFGEKFVSGGYILEVIQAGEKRTIKIVKG